MDIVYTLCVCVCIRRYSQLATPNRYCTEKREAWI
jgi:hypothetical protein